jgi:hypothetical protein
MQSSTSSIHLLLSLPTRDFNVYARAAMHLREIMGKKAPNVIVLMVHTLRCRDARGLADDYLESVGWPITTRKSSISGGQISPPGGPRRNGRKRSSLPAPSHGDLARN